MGLVQYADDGFFALRKIAEALRTTSAEVARTAGLGETPCSARNVSVPTRPSAGCGR